MAFDSYAVVAIPETDPVEFDLLFRDDNHAPNEPFMKHCGPYSEDEIRAQLKEMGIIPARIEALIILAKQKLAETQ
jgi:hypothetical protein